MPRFNHPNLAANLAVLEEIRNIARDAQCTIAQLALAWLLGKGSHVVAIPGTSSLEHLEENVVAAQVQLSADVIERLDRALHPGSFPGGRYPPETQQENRYRERLSTALGSMRNHMDRHGVPSAV
jgi:aryl-alcohol dehydrogenase-like predicted oxidoreductase